MVCMENADKTLLDRFAVEFDTVLEINHFLLPCFIFMCYFIYRLLSGGEWKNAINRLRLYSSSSFYV